MAFNCVINLGDDTPSWLNDEQLQTLLCEAERVVAEKSDSQFVQTIKLQKKIDRIIRQVDKYRRHKPNEAREINRFRYMLHLCHLSPFSSLSSHPPSFNLYHPSLSFFLSFDFSPSFWLLSLTLHPSLSTSRSPFLTLHFALSIPHSPYLSFHRALSICLSSPPLHFCLRICLPPCPPLSIDMYPSISLPLPYSLCTPSLLLPLPFLWIVSSHFPLCSLYLPFLVIISGYFAVSFFFSLCSPWLPLPLHFSISLILFHHTAMVARDCVMAGGTDVVACQHCGGAIEWELIVHMPAS